jgi:phosphonate transport system substrate-binding protein
MPILLLLLFTSNVYAYKFGVVPHQTPLLLAERWIPFIEKLEESSGIPLEFQTAKTVEEFDDNFKKGIYDFVYINPYSLLLYQTSCEYTVFAKDSLNKIRGIIVVHNESPITSLSELEGHTLAFPAPAAFGASILIQKELKKRKIKIVPKYVNTHDSVYLNVANKAVVAGGGICKTLHMFNQDGQNKLRIIFSTDAFSSHVFAVKYGVNKIDTDKVLTAMFNLDNHTPLLLKNIGLNAIVPASAKELTDIKELIDK